MIKYGKYAIFLATLREKLLMTNLAHYRYLILAVISFLLSANSPAFATPVFAKFVIPAFHPHAIYWAVLGILILTLLCGALCFDYLGEDDDYH